MEFLANNYQIVTSFSAIFISFIAVVIGYLQLKSAQIYQKLSVFPEITTITNVTKQLQIVTLFISFYFS